MAEDSEVQPQAAVLQEAIDSVVREFGYPDSITIEIRSEQRTRETIVDVRRDNQKIRTNSSSTGVTILTNLFYSQLCHDFATTCSRDIIFPFDSIQILPEQSTVLQIRSTSPW